MANNLIDFSKYSEHLYAYDGANHKHTLIIDNERYILKVSEQLVKKGNDTLKASSSFSPISEYVGCHIFEELGVPAQKTLLGIYKDKLAVACYDFKYNDKELRSVDWQLQEFSKLQTKLFSSSKLAKAPKIEQVEQIFDEHPALKTIKEAAKHRFWQTVVVDALIGNYDRHAGNWGYLVNTETGEARLAPVYDCGSTLNQNLSDEGIVKILKSKSELRKRILEEPKAALIINEKKRAYYEVLNLCKDKPELRQALLEIVPKIDAAKINAIIDQTPGISAQRIEYLKLIIAERKKQVLEHFYMEIKAAL